MRVLIGVVARLAMWVCIAIIVVDAVWVLWERHDYVWAVLAAVFFPITILVWPWGHDAFDYPLWYFLVAALVAYPISTIIGGLPTVDRPGDL